MRANCTREKSLANIQSNTRPGINVLVVISILAAACNNKNHPDTNHQLGGMYKLYIIENRDSTGAWKQQQWGKDGDGYIIYDGKGHMAVQITHKGYKDFAWLTEEGSINVDSLTQKISSMSPDELKEALKEFSSSYVYFANYTIEDTADIVVHHRISSSIPAIWGTTVRRSFSFSGDTLILRVLNGNRRLKWIRQN
jgi:hypothetical protein